MFNQLNILLFPSTKFISGNSGNVTYTLPFSWYEKVPILLGDSWASNEENPMSDAVLSLFLVKTLLSTSH